MGAKMKIPTKEELAALSGRISVEEGEYLMSLASQIQLGGQVVEIGSYCGKSTCYIAAGLLLSNNTSAKLHAIDLWTKGGTKSSKYHTEETWETWKRYVNKFEFGGLVIPHMTTSMKAVSKRKKPIDMLFLDGSHKYQSIHEDWREWKKFLFPGSIIAFHDYAEKWPGVMKVIDEEVILKYKLSNINQTMRLWSATYHGPK